MDILRSIIGLFACLFSWDGLHVFILLPLVLFYFPNIDEVDNENQLSLVEYVQDIYHFYCYIEVCPFCHGSLANCFCYIHRIIKVDPYIHNFQQTLRKHLVLMLYQHIVETLFL